MKKRKASAVARSQASAEVKRESTDEARAAQEEARRPYNYTVHSFITNELGLKHSEANVYALIHSFTRGKSGCYRGSIDGIVRMCNISRTTVIRALKSLLERGLVERRRKGKSSVYTYVTARSKDDTDTFPEVPIDTEAAQGEAYGDIGATGEAVSEGIKSTRVGVSDGIKMTQGAVPPSDTGKVSFCYGDSRIMRPNNNLYNNSIKKTTPPRVRAYACEPDEEENEEVTGRAPLRLAELDRFDNVILEVRQYERLIELYGDEITELYIRRLYHWIRDGSSGQRVTYGHYALLRKWIEADLAKL